jgi:hypothetical protein
MVSRDDGNYTRRILKVAALAADTARDAAAFLMGAPTGLADLMPPTGDRGIIAPFPKSATGGPNKNGFSHSGHTAECTGATTCRPGTPCVAGSGRNFLKNAVCADSFEACDFGSFPRYTVRMRH